MSVLLDAESRVLIQGIGGRFGQFVAGDAAAYGTNIVAGTAPGRRISEVEAIPVFESVKAARDATGADMAAIFIPASLALDPVLEAIEAGIPMVFYPGDGLPVRDAIEMRAAATANGATLVGPNAPGIISPGKAKIGLMPSFCYRPGSVGVVSRSGSLSYEVCWRLSNAGVGQTTVIGIGGDPVKGMTAGEAVALLHGDPETRAILFLGEIGGRDEYEVAEYAAQATAKPVAALLAGRAAPAGKKMGHAAALVGGYADTHAAKVDALREAGVHIAIRLGEIEAAVDAALEAA